MVPMRFQTTGSASSRHYTAGSSMRAKSEQNHWPSDRGQQSKARLSVGVGSSRGSEG
jgi:hypothetical protein